MREINLDDFVEDDLPPELPKASSNGRAHGPEPVTSSNVTAFDRLACIWADNITLELDRPGLIDGLLDREGMTVIYGESGSGKTFFALDLACHIGAGMPWRDMRVEESIVLYVAAESPGSVKRRVWAWRGKHGPEHLKLAVVQASVDLMNGSTEAVVAAIKEIEASTGFKVGLVVVDTLARAMTGNENAPEDMGKFVAACGRIREACGGHIIIVHHSGKDQARGARGHSSLRAATDVEIEITRAEDGTRTATIKKNRDGGEGDTYAYGLETVHLGVNAAGRMVTTCVVAPPAGQIDFGPLEPIRLAKSIRPEQKRALDILHTAICDHPINPPLAVDIPHSARGTTLDHWRETVRRYSIDDGKSEKRRNEAFKRTGEALQSAGLIRIVDGYVWPTEEGRKSVAGSQVGRMRPFCDPPKAGGRRVASWSQGRNPL